jgi:agmatine deiminase
MEKRTPASDGFSMPAEWSPHSICYISWPCKERTWHGHYDKSKAAYAGVIKAVSRFEPVTVLATPSTIAEARSVLGRGVNYLEVELDDSWVRDNGPIFVKDGDGRVALVKFRFNAWGGKYPPFDKDELVPDVIAKHLGMRRYDAPMILEGGSISVDGEGTLLTTEQCLLNVNRNPRMSREQIERILAEYLRLKKVIWLGKGVEEDITDGHVDGVATFAGPHLVVASHTKDDTDPNFSNLEENIARLESATDAKGKSIEVVRVVQPRPRKVDGLPITPGYTNHFIANGGVVVPTYGISEDTIALETLQGVYRDRKVVGVNASYIEIGGGAVHCITQQQPLGDPAQ